VLTVRQTWGEYRVFYQDAVGTLAALPATWTDVAAADPFVTIANGRSFCRVADLLRLCELIAETRR
jgi:hypothetical protein